MRTIDSRSQGFPKSLGSSNTRDLRMQTILPGRLWIAPAADVNSLRAFLNENGRAVIELAAEEPPATIPRDLIVVRFPLLDGPGNDAVTLELAMTTLRSLMQREIPTLVTCSAGMSRSPCIVAAGLALAENRAFDECLSEVTSIGPVDISPGLLQDVMDAFSRLRDG